MRWILLTGGGEFQKPRGDIFRYSLERPEKRSLVILSATSFDAESCVTRCRVCRSGLLIRDGRAMGAAQLYDFDALEFGFFAPGSEFCP